jgi:glycosyltransferase involved in cell wall biosynthesis
MKLHPDEGRNLMQPTPQPKIAFLAEVFICWTGGVDFLRLCIGGIDSVLPDATRPVLVPEPTVPQRALAFAVATKRRIWSLAGKLPAVAPPVSIDHLRDSIANMGCSVEIVSYHGNPKGLARAMRKLDVQVVLPCFLSPGKDFPLNWVGYIADLQHKRLPGNFSRRERLKRDWELGKVLADASAVIVNSRSAIRDIQEFYPEGRATLFALPFCPPVNPDVLNDVSDDVLRPYDLPQKYFIISNQLWVHKSHETAFAALRLVSDAGFNDVHILCTGNLHDFRAPGHFDRLKQTIARDGLSDRIRFLGVIPKRHQLALMRRSIAVVQPTLFEGGPGGGAVYDAVSTATPAIVSDIDVNREVDFGVVEFFRAGSAQDLAEKMVGMLTNPPERLSAQATLSMLQQRRRQMGETLLNVVSFVTGTTANVARNKAGKIQKTPLGQ